MDVLIVQEEKHVARQVCEYIEKYDPAIRIVGVLQTVKQSIDWLRMNTADLIFMDIHLYDGVCFDIFEKVNIHTPIIFSTAYNDFAIQAFENNGIAYISKPFTYDNVIRALKKISRLSRSLSMINEYELMKELNGVKRRRFMVYAEKKIASITIEDVAYFYTLDKSIYLVDVSGQHYVIDYSLEYLESILPESDFFRINRRYLLSIRSILKMRLHGTNRIKIELKLPGSDDDMIVSGDRAPKFKLWLDGVLV
jgi:DNA-binding LytR/AlgR family response regulator